MRVLKVLSAYKQAKFELFLRRNIETWNPKCYSCTHRNLCPILLCTYVVTNDYECT